ncbi:MAG: hypothetical protein A3D75_01425 [Candidatus Levybacteria bacterium RIFCSPHIGHO2_02_FULL_37_18]|nr:MAG: hypothetical protein A2770_04165 [Candidatus Levybacteria bacterium RIFCSPHIGHO2_01_FULL_38_12]OGH21834.1 MAG: hypothetical protein A3D75_01425 [Candidatus Levybacteria bacterium RIFCSPHIGHO2_02_FULL_37_18]OGH33455.1 MAG: hypothetical protein A3A47_04375 [Candidatus Levybacteria bacterium RIFCSPLOWO2_01_FULL_37_20]OGH44046.1 MAG: hypothetical protein A3J14_04850 [Candidatus Levybacteria bacterium RIFCSPLOWO2_02_FULL_37_18]
MQMAFRKKLLFIVLIFISLLSLFPRAVEILNKNYVFGLDQGRDYLAVKKIVEDHKLTLIGPELGNGYSGISYVFHGPIYYYFLSIPFLLTGGDPYGGVVLMFLFGIGSIILSYKFGKRLYGEMGGWISALLMAISPPIISQSRFVWNPHIGTFFILLSFFYSMQISKSKKYLFLSALCSAFTYNFDLGIAAVVCISLLLYAVIVLRIKSRESYAFLAAGFLIGFLPMMLFELRHGFHGFMNIVGYIQKPALAHQRDFLLDHLQTIRYIFIDTFPKQIIVDSILGIGMIAFFFVYFLFQEKNRERKNILLFLSFLPIIVFLVFIPLKNSIYGHYLTELNIMIIVVVVYITSAAWEKSKILFAPILVFLLLITFVGVQSAITITRSDIKDFGGDNKIKGLTEVIDYIYKDAHGKKFGVYEFSPAVLTDRYDYLFMWYGKKKYGYIPYKEKKGLVYLLIEVDKSKPWSYKGWLETVIEDGVVLDTHTLASGFIVQKRMFPTK